jgi:hypothetical protein
MPNETSLRAGEFSDAPSDLNPSLTRALLACGVAAGPLYLGVGLAHALARPGAK